MASGTGSGALAVGVSSSSEVVWCGDQPIVLRGLVQVGGSKFVHLAKDKYGDLCRCLLGATERRVNMGIVQVFSAITALRNDACKDLVSELMASGNEEAGEDASGKPDVESVDITASLGFDDAPAPVESPAKRPRAVARRKLSAARTQLPRTTLVTYPARLGQPARELRILVETGTKSRRSASLELSAENLQWLRAVVRAELGTADAAPPASSSASGSSPTRPRPRGSAGNREYFVSSKNRWVRKRLVQGGKDGQRRYRVLTRRPTPIDQPAALPRAAESGSEVADEGQDDDLTAALGL